MDTIHTIHLSNRKGKFELPPLNVRKNYTIVFKHGSRVKTLYVSSAGPEAMSTYYMKLSIDMLVDYGGGDIMGSAEYVSKKDKYKVYTSQSLKNKY